MDLNQVTLPCFDYDASVEFYRAMGFVLIVDSPPRYARFECGSGATFSLHRVERDAAAIGQSVIYFETPRLDETVAALERRGVEFDSAPADQRWLWREARLTDPAGNRLCLYHAGENRRYPPWRIAPRDET